MASRDEITVDPATLRSGATKFSTAADQLDDARAALETGLNAQGACWGDDEGGQKFAEGYVPGQQQVVEAFRSLVEALRNVRTNVEATAADHENTDQANARNLGNQGV